MMFLLRLLPDGAGSQGESYGTRDTARDTHDIHACEQQGPGQITLDPASPHGAETALRYRSGSLAPSAITPARGSITAISTRRFSSPHCSVRSVQTGSVPTIFVTSIRSGSTPASTSALRTARARRSPRP